MEPFGLSGRTCFLLQEECLRRQGGWRAALCCGDGCLPKAGCGPLYAHGLDQKDFYIAAFGVILILFIDLLHERGVAVRERIGRQKLFVRWVFYYGALVSLLILGIYGPGFDAASFVYGAF